ncbi:MAG: EmrB/QacA family drug resistance transporter, partial [Nostoc sp.]
TQRQHFHSERIGESISLYNLQTQERLDQLTQLFINQGSDPSIADDQSIAMLDNLVRQEAYVMAYNDCFYIIAIAFFLGCFLVLFLKKVSVLSTR